MDRQHQTRLTHTECLLNDRKLTPVPPHMLLSFLVVMSSARDVSPIHWTDYTRGSERGHAEGVTIASRRSSSS